MGRRGPLRALTKRQREIADGIGQGLSYAEIGAVLGISAHTVSSMVRSMALLFDVDGEYTAALAPRQVIWAWMMFERWSAEHASLRPTTA